MANIALVNMPFCSARAPSLQLGLIKALLARAGMDSDIHYLNLDFAAATGPALYELVSGTPDPMLGEWIFTKAAFPEFGKAHGYLARIEDFLAHVEAETGATRADLIGFRERLAPEFVEQAAEKLAPYPIVGFTSTFQQNVPSLALAMAIKRRNPDTTIVFGGANVEGSVGREFLKSFACIDAVVSGECDSFVADLFSALLNGDSIERFPAVHTRRSRMEAGAETNRATFGGSMDGLPVPDYSDFFRRRAELGLDRPRSGEAFIYTADSEHAPYVPFESSRGCWWGQKHHCTFCGLNAGGMKFRARSYEATVDLIEELHRRHGATLFYAVDNIIDTTNIVRFCDLLIERKLGVSIFYEVKSNLRPAMIGKMAAAGIRYVQPGIESFSDSVLHLMRKGVSALHNLNTLRWLRTSEIKVAWNILYGFPGETVKDYDDQLSLVKKIHHLPPPARLTRIRIDRYSPNFFDPHLRAQFGTLNIMDAYDYIYPDEVDRNEAAHFFYPREKPPTALSDEEVSALAEEVAEWNRKWSSSGKRVGVATPTAGEMPFLQFEWLEDRAAIIFDGRVSPASPKEYLLSPVEARTYAYVLERPQDIRSLREISDRDGLSEEALATILNRFEELGILHTIGSKTLALATANLEEVEPRAQAA